MNTIPRPHHSAPEGLPRTGLHAPSAAVPVRRRMLTALIAAPALLFSAAADLKADEALIFVNPAANHLDVADITEPGVSRHLIHIDYSPFAGIPINHPAALIPNLGAREIDLRTLGDGDILVEGPHGYAQRGTFVRAEPLPVPAIFPYYGPTVRATYFVTPPANAAGADLSWTERDNGTYTVSVQPEEVGYIERHEDGVETRGFLLGERLGSFLVELGRVPALPIETRIEIVPSAFFAFGQAGGVVVDPNAAGGAGNANANGNGNAAGAGDLGGVIDGPISISAYAAEVDLVFSDAGHRVIDWGQVRREGNRFFVNVVAVRLPGPAAEVITTFSHRYELGGLVPGDYVFTVTSLDERLGSEEFTVPGVEPPDPVPPAGARVEISAGANGGHRAHVALFFDVNVPLRIDWGAPVTEGERIVVDVTAVPWRFLLNADGQVVVDPANGIIIVPPPDGGPAVYEHDYHLGRLDDGDYVFAVTSLGEVVAAEEFTVENPVPGPSAHLRAEDVLEGGGETHRFHVIYGTGNPGGIDLDSLGDDDVVVRSFGPFLDPLVANLPPAFEQVARLVDVEVIDPAINFLGGAAATYEIDAPGGTWGPEDNAFYQVALLPETVFDADGNVAPAARLGGFVARVPRDGPILPEGARIEVVATSTGYAAVVQVELAEPHHFVSDWGEVRRDGRRLAVDITVSERRLPPVDPVDPNVIVVDPAGLVAGGVVVEDGVVIIDDGGVIIVDPNTRHVYRLGVLEPGDYTFSVLSAGEEIETVEFTVEEPDPILPEEVAIRVFQSADGTHAAEVKVVLAARNQFVSDWGRVSRENGHFHADIVISTWPIFPVDPIDPIDPIFPPIGPGLEPAPGVEPGDVVGGAIALGANGEVIGPDGVVIRPPDILFPNQHVYRLGMLEPGDYVFSIGVAGQVVAREAFTVTPNSRPPSARLEAEPVNEAGAATYEFSVIYRDDSGVDVASLGDDDVLVQGVLRASGDILPALGGLVAFDAAAGADLGAILPDVVPDPDEGHFRQLARLLAVAIIDEVDGPGGVLARYEIDAPGGAWDAGDNGFYWMTLMPDSVADNDGNTAPRQHLGGFGVHIEPEPPVPAEVTLAVEVDGSEAAAQVVITFGGPYFISDPGEPRREGNRVVIDATAEEAGPNVRVAGTIEREYDLGEFAPGRYVLDFRINGFSYAQEAFAVEGDPIHPLGAEIEIVQSATGDYSAVVVVELASRLHYVSHWGEVEFEGNRIWVDIRVSTWTRLPFDPDDPAAGNGVPGAIIGPDGIIIGPDGQPWPLNRHTYRLGQLENGEWSFSVLSRGEPVATETFVVEPPRRPPTASLAVAEPVTEAGGETYRFRVEYWDDTGIDFDSLGDDDILVQSALNFIDIAPPPPGTFTQLARLVEAFPLDALVGGRGAVAVYEIDAPGGTWGPEDNGHYLISLEGDSVADLDGNTAAPARLGNFAARIHEGGPIVPEGAEIEIFQGNIAYFAEVEVKLASPLHYVSDWGQVRHGDDGRLVVEIEVSSWPIVEPGDPVILGGAVPGAVVGEDGMIIFPPDFRPNHHTYNLGVLDPGEYRFELHAAGELVEAEAFTVRPFDPGPSAELTVRAIHEEGREPHPMVVVYTDPSGIDADSLGDDDLRVTPGRALNGGIDGLLPPGNIGWPVELVDVERIDEETVRAHYVVHPPQGGWTHRLNGVYNVFQQARSVLNNNGTPAPAGVIGVFSILIEPGTGGVPAEAKIDVRVGNDGGAKALVEVEFSVPTWVISNPGRPVRVGNRVVIEARAQEVVFIRLPDPPWVTELEYDLGRFAPGDYEVVFLINGEPLAEEPFSVGDPGGPLPDVASIDVHPVDDGGHVADVSVILPNPWTRVVSWGEVVREGDHFIVDIRVEEIHIQGGVEVDAAGNVIGLPLPPEDAALAGIRGGFPVRLVTHRYDLGVLGSGEYVFLVTSRGQRVAAEEFKVRAPGGHIEVRFDAEDILHATDEPHRFSVAFTARSGIDLESVESATVRVFDRHNWVGEAALVSIASTRDLPPTQAVATYEITGPGGSWDAEDRGLYRVYVDPDDIRDLAGNTLDDDFLGHFRALIWPDMPPPDPAGDVTLEVGVEDGVGFATVALVLPADQEVVAWGEAALRGHTFAMSAEIAVTDPPDDGTRTTFRHTYRLGELRPGHYRVVFSTSLGHEAHAALHVPGDRANPVDGWKAIAFAALESSGDATLSILDDMADPDGDGLNNLLEYAFGLDPLEPRRPAVRTHLMRGQDGFLRLAYSFDRIAGATDVIYQIQVSADLSNWIDADNLTDLAAVDDNGDGTEAVTVCLRDAIEQSAYRYIRLRVRRAPER